MAIRELTAERVRDLFLYDPSSGLMTWRMSRGSAKAGSVAGSTNSHGYRIVMIDKKSHALHRLAWLYMTGKWPANELDHVDGIRANNIWANLRDVTVSVNQQNRRAVRNKHGLMGIFKVGRKFAAVICTNGKRMRLGAYATPEEAHAVYVSAKRQFHVGFST